MKFETNPADLFSSKAANSIPIRAVTKGDLKAKKSGISAKEREWAKSSNFDGSSGQHCLVPNADGTLHSVLFGLGDGISEKTGFELGRLAGQLPDGTFKLDTEISNADLGWALGGYRFAKYKKSKSKSAKLIPDGGRPQRRLIEGSYIARDLINIPASDMGPDALEKAFRKIATKHKAKVQVVKGDQLLKRNFPMVHAVGRASVQAPRVLDLRWGKANHPKVTLIGKGVTFDTGGLNIKPGNSMSLMKKDMGGAANVLGLAHMIMDARLPVRLRVIIGAVENAISGNAFRPGDVLPSRNGMSVEIGNTDAEGRLVLGDCLTLGDEEKPQIMIDMATLTGAARVALGPDLPPFYTDDDAFAAEILSASDACFDPLWRMPLWQPYNAMMTSKVADVNHINTSGAGFAGSITAALFLQRFVSKTKSWVHFDIYGWTPAQKPWAPVGGEAQGIRALYEVLSKRYG